MIKRTLVAAAVTAAALGTGGVALAATDNSNSVPSRAALSTSAAPATTTPAAAIGSGHKGLRRARLGNALHGTWVTKRAKTGTVITHDAIRGTVGAVSATTITVTSADGFAQSYAVTGDTKVRVVDVATRKPVKVSISAVKPGARVLVVGTGTSSLTAARVVVRKQK
jgi:hypothetical protein